MTIENPASFQFFMTEDLYLVKTDTEAITANTPITIVAEPDPIFLEIPAPIVAEAPAVIETPAPTFKYLGKNQKNFLIVFHSNGAGKFDEKHFEALKNTLQRKELSVDDTAIIDLHQHPDKSVSHIADYFKPTRVLLLGSQCLLSGWDTLALNVLTPTPGYTALYTYSFAEMMADKDKVRAFWEQMKAL